jgi:hypothetical protein
MHIFLGWVVFVISDLLYELNCEAEEEERR